MVYYLFFMTQILSLNRDTHSSETLERIAGGLIADVNSGDLEPFAGCVRTSMYKSITEGLDVTITRNPCVVGTDSWRFQFQDLKEPNRYGVLKAHYLPFIGLKYS